MRTASSRYGYMATPALDVKPVGRLPYLVGQTGTDGPREHTEHAACPVYPGLCVGEDGDTSGEHFDHSGHTYSVTGPDSPDDPEIWAEFIHFSTSVPRIGFMGADLTPEQTRLKARELRRLADEMDALANQVDAATASRPTPVEA